jgi:sarco/endoplasmic reticulum calcium-translocating P-type ATPase/plasma-membrane calcium-translocating P-type ATPase
MDIKTWHQMKEDRVYKELETGTHGLSKDEALKRQEKYGFNELASKKGKTIWRMLFEQFTDVLVLILIVAAIISGTLGETSDAAVIMIVVVLNAALGAFQENRAEKSLAALKKLAAPAAVAIRDGKAVELRARELVPGDIVLLEAGRFVPADCRLIEVSNLKVEESSLTGESVPVDKISGIIEEENAALGDRKNMVFMSSMVTYGRGTAVVVNTGMNTEIGKIAAMIQEEDKTLTPLQIKLEELGKWLGIISVGVCAAMFFIGVFNGRNYLEMFMTAVSLAVAAIPEGLPAVVTIVLAIGVQRMIKKNAIIRKLPAVETLGCATVICSDKTGTLTQNKMTVMKVFADYKLVDSESIDISEESSVNTLLEIIALCNDSKMIVEDDNIKTIGDPTETALVEIAYKKGLDKRELEKAHKRLSEIPFDSDRKLMTTINQYEGSARALIKGAPDLLLDRCRYILDNGTVRELNEDDLLLIKAMNENMGKDALRVLAAGYRDMDKVPQNVDSAAVENDIVFVGLTGMIDPPREEVKEAVRICKAAGIRPVMITGDHKVTAMAIARELGILDDSHEAISGAELDNISDEELKNSVEKYCVYARVSPEHKVRIVNAWQGKGDIVAMTGDGVNDAPALKRADIGAAMGITGTDVAKEAADMVLTDDNFATIISAVEEGRVIFSNIKKSIHFLLSCNIGEIITLFVATAAGWIEPLIPIHILWVNLITDTLPALALGLDPAEKGIMKQKPRNPRSGIFSEGLGLRIGLGGIMIGGLSLLIYNLGLKYDIKTAQTMTFAVLSMSQIAHAFNVRSEKQSLFKIGVFSNKYLVIAAIASVFLQVIVIFTPFLRSIFKVSLLTGTQWLLVALLSIMPIIIVEIVKLGFRWIKK